MGIKTTKRRSLRRVRKETEPGNKTLRPASQGRPVEETEGTGPESLETGTPGKTAVVEVVVSATPWETVRSRVEQVYEDDRLTAYMHRDLTKANPIFIMKMHSEQVLRAHSWLLRIANQRN